MTILDFLKIIKGILKRKNRQIRGEREKLAASELSNRILTAYIALLCEDRGVLQIPKSEVSAVLGRVSSRIAQSETHYIIELTGIGGADGKDIFGVTE